MPYMLRGMRQPVPRTQNITQFMPNISSDMWHHGQQLNYTGVWQPSAFGELPAVWQPNAFGELPADPQNMFMTRPVSLMLSKSRAVLIESNVYKQYSITNSLQVF